MKLTKEEIQIILAALAKVYGPGYASYASGVGPLQAKLSVMLETAR